MKYLLITNGQTRIRKEGKLVKFIIKKPVNLLGLFLELGAANFIRYFFGVSLFYTGEYIPECVRVELNKEKLNKEVIIYSH